MLFFILIILFGYNLIFSQIIEPPIRNVDIWDLFGTSTTKRSGKSHHKEEVIIRLSIGEIVGQKVIIPNLPWTAFQDPNEQIPPDRNSPEPNPLPLLNNVTIFTFLGVPYAEPPLGERRFKAPQQLIHLPGDSPFIAFTLPPVCAQDIETKPTLFINSPYPYQINEDCLYLNIYTPTIKFASVSESALPVIVFFHGGNFQTGSANDWPGHVLASHGIVVVNVNYRLGPFGIFKIKIKNIF